MSWIVQSLLNNRDSIRENSYKTGEIEDDFSDLMLVEKALERLISLSLVSEKDLQVLDDSFKLGKTKIQKELIELKKQVVCNRIAYYLGGYFTDEGYLEYLRKKHQLTEPQMQLVRAYIKSEYKNKTLRKGFRIGINHEENQRYVSA
jgi:hypothetical protein